MIGTVAGLKGEFRQVSLNESIVVLPGDTASISGNQMIVTRNGQVVAVRILTGEAVIVPLGADYQEVIDRVMYFWRAPVAGIVATLTNVVKNLTTGAIRFDFSNGSQREFANGAAAIAETDYLDTSPTIAEDVLIRKTLVNSPDETNLHTVVGGKCSIDMNANNPVTLTID